MSELSGEKITALFWDEGWEIGGTTTVDELEYFHIYLDGTSLQLGPVWPGEGDDWVMDSDDIYVRGYADGTVCSGPGVESEESLIVFLKSVLEDF